MPKSNRDVIEFDDVSEFIDLLRTRQKSLTDHKNELPTDWQKRACIERIDEVDHFIDLIIHSNLRIVPGVNNLYLLKSAKKKPRIKKEIGDKPTAKKWIILKYIKERDDAVTGAEVAAALGFEIASVSAHLSALKSASYLENADGLWKATEKV